MTDLTIALVGNPNCGKTTLFNALTGAKLRVANWPGVTVECKSGVFQHQNKKIEVVDLPGTYSLRSLCESNSMDERIACEWILSKHAQLIVNVLDASNLERNLYLTMQLIEMQVPMVVVVSMGDIAKRRGMRVDLQALAKGLGCPVIAIEGGKNISGLKDLVAGKVAAPKLIINYDPILEQAIGELGVDEDQSQLKRWTGIRLLEEDEVVKGLVKPETLVKLATWQQKIQLDLNEDADILLAEGRYHAIKILLEQCLVKVLGQGKSWTQWIDDVVMNRILGIPVFLMVMYGMFLFAINIGGAFQDFFDIGSSTIFVDGVAHGLNSLGAPAWLVALLADGVGKGINTTVTFIPVIGALFLFLAFLEDSGYMARAAFVVDRLMRALGLPGKSFVPMIVGFGCNVPAVMATRTLENRRDRILTIMMTPFMSCGARLAIYAVFTAAFFPVGGQNIVFGLYLFGIVMAMLTGLLLRQTLLPGDPAPLIMELPPYHLPNFKSLLLHAWERLQGFIVRAGKLIVPICILIGVLGALNIDGSLNTSEGSSSSLLSALGRFITPVFAPMGIQADNWPATVGLATGILAKEVVVGTLNALYSQMGHLTALHADGFSFWGGLSKAVMSIPTNFAELGSSLGNPILAQAPMHSVNQGVYGIMYQHFDGQMGALAYLLFILLYFPCVSTTAVMVRELNRGWTIFSVIWTTSLAYCVAVAFYQTATFSRHPLSSTLWLIALVNVLFLGVAGVRFFGNSSSWTPIRKISLESV